MKHVFFAVILVTVMTSFKLPISSGKSCEIKEFYESVDSGKASVLTKSGKFEEVELLLKPAKMKEGVFTVSLTRKAANLYKVEGTDSYLETRYCYEFAMHEQVILKVESNYGYTKGKVIFD
jgi:hypothetical protein